MQFFSGPALAGIWSVLLQEAQDGAVPDLTPLFMNARSEGAEMPEDTRRASAKARTTAGMQEVEQRREQLPRRTRCRTSSTFAEPNAVDSGRYAFAAVGS